MKKYRVVGTFKSGTEFSTTVNETEFQSLQKDTTVKDYSVLYDYEDDKIPLTQPPVSNVKFIVYDSTQPFTQHVILGCSCPCCKHEHIHALYAHVSKTGFAVCDGCRAMLTLTTQTLHSDRIPGFDNNLRCTRITEIGPVQLMVEYMVHPS